MALGRMARSLIAGVLGLTQVSPIWGFGLLYLYDLPADALPEAPEEGVSPVELLEETGDH